MPGAPAPLAPFARAFGIMIVSAAQFFIVLAYLPTFAQRHGGIDRATSLWLNALTLALAMLAIPAFGRLSDRVGRRPLLIGSCIVFLVLPYPLFALVAAMGPLALVIALQLAAGLAIAMYSGPLPATLAELFPTRSRASGVSIANATSVAIFGGFAPFIATWLIQATGTPIAPVYYVIACAGASLAAVLLSPESAPGELR